MVRILGMEINRDDFEGVMNEKADSAEIWAEDEMGAAWRIPGEEQDILVGMICESKDPGHDHAFFAARFVPEENPENKS